VRVDLAGVDSIESDDSYRGLDALDAEQRYGIPPGTFLELADALDETVVPQPTGDDRLARRASRHRVHASDPIADVEVGPPRLLDSDCNRFVAVGDSQMCGRPNPIGEIAQDGLRRLAEPSVRGGCERQQTERHSKLSVVEAPDQVVLDERREQSVDHRTADLDRCRELADRHTMRTAGGQELEDPDSPIESLRSLTA
jgi:hypothetical protein